MYAGKTLFAQVMEFVPWTSFVRIVQRHGGNSGVRTELQLDASLYTCLQILSVSVFEKTEVSCALQADASQTVLPDAANQLTLFDF